MARTITRISPWRTSRIVALVFGITGVAIVLLMYVLSQFGTRPWLSIPTVMFITVPLLSGFLSFVVSFSACLVYNMGAKILGGIEYVSEESPRA